MRLPGDRGGLVGLALAAWLQGADAPYAPYLAPASDEPLAARERIRPAEGLELALVAAEPLLANPVCLAIDEHGGIFVGETFRHHRGVTDIRDHMDWLDEDLASRTVADRLAMFRRHLGEEGYADYGKEHERVRLLRDLDGDGAADVSTVFADGFHDQAAGIGAGLLARRGDVYYTCIPDLWLLRDEDGDGRADFRERLSTGYGVHVALLGHDLHGLRIGPDRRLYFSSGDRGFHVETESGVLAHARSGAVLRCELDGTGLEVWHSGLRNPQELAFDAFGDLFTGDNNSDGGDRARWVNVVEGGDSGWRYGYQWITEPVARGPWNDEKMWHPPHPGQPAFLVPPIANLADGPSGLAYHPGTGLDPRYAEHFFLCDFRGGADSSGIHAFRTLRRGAFWELGPVEHLVWGVLATDADFGPDGALYLTDWVQGWNIVGKGRVWRLSEPSVASSALVAETRALIEEGMDGRDLAELEELLGHLDQRVRQEAEFALVDRGEAGAAVLARAALEAPALLARLHGIWGLGVAQRAATGSVEPLVALVADDDPEVRTQALDVLGDVRFAPAAAAVAGALDDPEPRVRFQAALAAGRLGLPDAVPGLVRCLEDAREDDPNLRHAAVMGLVGCADAERLASLAGSPSRWVRMGVLLALRRRADPLAALFLADPDRGIVAEAARAIHDAPIPAALPALRALAHGAATEPPIVRRVLDALLQERSGDAAQAVAELALRPDLDEALRAEALAILRAWEAPAQRDRVLGEFRRYERIDAPYLSAVAVLLFERGIASAPPRVLVPAVRLAAESGAAELAPLFAPWVGDAERPPEVRSAALEALATLGSPLLASSIDVAFASAAPELRSVALRALRGLAPDVALERLGDVLADGGLVERRTALELLAELGGAAAAVRLEPELARLEAGVFPAELALDLVLAVEASGDPALRARLDARRARLAAADPVVGPFADALFGGDPDAGRRVFERPDLSCARCHATWDEGVERVGPSLVGVGKRLPRLAILESFLAPNRRTTPGYGSTVFFLADGKAVAGRVLGESESSVRLMDSEGRTIELDLADVEERRPDLSPMPEDVAASLTPAEVRDLIAYLAGL